MNNMHAYLALAIAFTTTAARADDTPVVAVAEFQPAPRLGVGFEHSLSPRTMLLEQVAFGFGHFPDLEIRGTLSSRSLGPVAPWLAYRIRRTTLTGLPPIEDHASVGLSVASDARRRISLAGGFGVRFQLPPLVPSMAHNRGAYLQMGVAPVLFFNVRVRAW
jgi:hypothetical protein